MIHRFILCALAGALSIHSINADSFQGKHTASNDHNNFITSLQKELRSPQYRKEVLPNDFSYLSELIHFGKNNNQPPAYLRSVIKMFSNMLKSPHYVNAYAFSDLLETLPLNINHYFAMPAASKYISNSALYDASFTDRFKSTVHTALYSKFSNEYESFRQDPNQFLKSLSADIVGLAQEEIAQEQIRQSIIRLCEIALSKLIWNPAESTKTWDITKKISEQLAVLLEQNILDDSSDLDDLYWTLLNRYCYFIEIAATDLPESFYTAIKQDINEHKAVLFALPEQDFIVEPKLSYMQRTLIESQSRAYGYKHGLIRN